MNKGISIIISYYFGEKYFAEQLASVVYQMNSHDELLIRDDGSASISIIEKECRKNVIASRFLNQGKIKLITSENLGVNKSFLCLLKLAQKEVSVFCDQDDVWIDGRLESVRRHYDSSLHIVNFEVHSVLQLSNSFIPKVFPIFLRNKVPGCCMSGKTNQFIDILSSIQSTIIYDHALLLKMLFKKKKITFDPIARVKYNRHGENLTKFKSLAPNGILKALKLRFDLWKMMMSE